MNNPEQLTTQGARQLPRPKRKRRSLRIVHSEDSRALDKVFELDGYSVWRLGRSVGGTDSIGDLRLSREHSSFEPIDEDGNYIVRDLNSRNGTFHNGVRVTEPVRLSADDVISAGDTLLVVDETPDPDSLPATNGILGEQVREYIGISHSAQRVRASIASLADGDGAALILGETGTGKEVVAKAVHRLSARAKQPWVATNCAAIPEGPAEVVLFGSFPGAFTGALKVKGKFEQASGGTIFLDEIGDLAGELQPKLLRVLQEQIVEPLAGNPVAIDTRVLAATKINLHESGFREDLYARLSAWVMYLPPLRERRADVLVLWDHFVGEIRGGEVPRRTAELSEALLLYPWPLNVRELKQLAERLARQLAGERVFDLHHLPEAMQQPIFNKRDPRPLAIARPQDAPTMEIEPMMIAALRASRQELEAALRAERGNIAAVARKGGWHKTQVYRRIQKLGIDIAKFR